MKRKQLSLLGAGCLTAMALTLPQEASAMPAYARQTGLSCAACHFQRYPLLNQFGRAFKQNGYTQKGKQYTIEDTNLSLPTTLNATLVSKFRYVRTTAGTDQAVNAGIVDVPDEASFFLAGRVANNIGFQADIGIISGGAGIGGFKMPFIIAKGDYTLQAIPFFTDAQGPQYGYELLNTGAVEYSRVFERAADTTAAQYITKAPNEVKVDGVALVAQNKFGYINVTPYFVDGGGTSPSKMMNYIRAVYTHPSKVGNFDVAGGVQYWKGTSQDNPDELIAAISYVDAWAVDAQAQGKVGDYDLGLYAAYAVAPKSTGALPTNTNMYNPSMAANRSAFSLVADLGVIPSVLGVEVGYRAGASGDGGSDSDNAFTLGATYNVARNVTMQLSHSFYSYGADVVDKSLGDSRTTFVLFSAF